MKILIGIIIAILIIIGVLFGIYFAAFRPSVETTSVADAGQINISSIAQKFTPQDIVKSIGINTNDINGTKTVKLNSKDLSNLAAYAVSKSPAATKYVTGVKVEPKGKKLDLYLTTKVHGVPSQAKLIFNVKSENGKGVLHYDSGKVGFIPIPQSILFDKLRDNGYITVNKNNGTITINPAAEKGLNIAKMNISNSELNLELNKIKNQVA
ncbi:hypothetical protein [uncultured Clostridium sp.]|jgi:hypothetical protein|uniref:hypothetical protein n=1 Tax=uncultured Clostridium sp. TaxID=59620 RepID=UPI0026101048|nr:hypothetical protein [uncultured Clostridium sp.]